MEEVIPWTQPLAVIEPHYPKGQRSPPDAIGESCAQRADAILPRR
jgi:hypothetical protein